MLVFADVRIGQDGLIFVECHKRAGELGLPVSDRFHFLSGQYQAGLELIKDFIVKSCFFVCGVGWHSGFIIACGAHFANRGSYHV